MRVAGYAFACLLFLVAVSSARADVGLIIETPTGILGFLSDVGHSSVWISHGCLSQDGEVQFCENTPGIVLTSTAYWPNPGAAAIPAELFFLGSRPGIAGHSSAAWSESMGVAYPHVKAALGSKYMGRVWRRGMRVMTFTTTSDEDRRVLAAIEQQRRDYHYSYSHRNCAFYAQEVLKLYLGDHFHANRSFDLGIETPRALERALRKRLEADPASRFRVVRFRGTMAQSWRQPPRSFCETAIFDPKYALPLLWFQPYIYAGFGACYGVTRFLTSTRNRHDRQTADAQVMPLALGFGTSGVPVDSRLAAYQSLTGSLPATSAWFSVPALVPFSNSEQFHAPVSQPAF